MAAVKTARELRATRPTVLSTATLVEWQLWSGDVTAYLEAQAAAEEALEREPVPGLTEDGFDYTIGGIIGVRMLLQYAMDGLQQERDTLREYRQVAADPPLQVIPEPPFEVQIAALGAKLRYVTGTAEAPRSHTVIVTAENGESAEYYTPRQNVEALAFAAENRAETGYQRGEWVGSDPASYLQEPAAPTVPPNVTGRYTHADGQRHPMPEGLLERFRERGATATIGQGEQGPRWIIRFAEAGRSDLAAHEMGGAEWEEVIREAEEHDTRPPLREWEGEDGGEEAVRAECWRRGWLCGWAAWLSPPRHFVVVFPAGDENTGIATGHTPSAALLAAFRTARVPTPWKEGTEAQKEAAAVDNSPDPWQPPETVEGCLGYLGVRVECLHFCKGEAEVNIWVTRSHSELSKDFGGDKSTQLSALQDACRWVHEREKETTYADAS